MQRSAGKASLVAVDLGAQSCRVSILRWKQGVPQIEVIHRFSNAPISTATGLHWNINAIFEGVSTGLRTCAEAAPEGVASIGVDGWAVDYVRLRSDGSPFGNPFCYRDERTAKAVAEVHRLISPDRLYSLTGIQLLSLNTLYQLYADKLAGIDSGSRWLNLPEYVTHLLGGKPVSEYTNATHTQLVTLGTRNWCDEIFQAIGLEKAAAPEIVPTGSIVGTLDGPLSTLPAFCGTRLIVPACHDTASAIAAIPAKGEDWAFISSGTWSLVGTVLNSPCITKEARELNFTNLGGVGGTTCFLKNVNGMWLLRQCMDEWERLGQHWTLPDLIRQCALLPQPQILIDLDAPELVLPGKMLGKINAQCNRAGHESFLPDSRGIPLLANTIFHSLARRYAEVLSAITGITGKKLKRLFIVGGGSKNTFLNRLTAEYSRLEVVPGSSESTTIGNFAIQMATLQDEGSSSHNVTAARVAEIAQTISFNSTPILMDEDKQPRELDARTQVGQTETSR
jgi:rhamnulokinase